MESVMRFWGCAMRDRSNETSLALDGTVKREQCSEPTQLRNLNRTNRLMRGGRSVALILALVGAGITGIARGQVVTEFPVLTASSQPPAITAGPDGNLWFTEGVGNNIGRITTAGVVTEFPVLTASSGLFGIAAGPDGNVWFTEYTANNIGRITPAGVVTEFPVLTASSKPTYIAAGPDGSLWFTEYLGNKIGRITPAGVVTEFPVLTASSALYGIAAGPDGNRWFTEGVGNNIGRITTAGVVTEFPVLTASSGLYGIVAGPDGSLWFTEYIGNNIGRITTAGVVSEFPVPTASSQLTDIAAGPDGNLWFTEYLGNKIGRITTAGIVTEFPVLTVSSGLYGIAAGPDGNVWFTEYTANNIGRITTRPLTPQPVTADAHAQTGSNSNLNGVLEPGETVQVAPSWKNTLTAAQGFTGTATNLTGPAGPTYTINTASANYGSVAGGATQDCNTATGDCYLMTVSGARPVADWDVTFTETLSLSPIVPGSIVATRTIHVGESFSDVPTSNPDYAFIENLLHNGITGGCAGGGYCPSSSVTRAQMAVFLMKSKLGKGEMPPPATGTVFSDVPASNPFAPWIEQLAGFGITGGCGDGKYCPNDPVTRAQMAVFLLKTQHGSLYTPPACTGVFSDVPCPSQFANWIVQLFHENVTSGCGSGMYCPNNPVNRGQMAVFLVKAFGLQLN
jgi:streptogramin lyase